MSTLTTNLPVLGQLAGFHRFSVSEYHRLIQDGHLTEDDELELIEGYLVLKMPHDPVHDGTIQLVQDALAATIPPGWCIRIQSAVTLPESEPEPGLAVVRGNKRTYLDRHPGPADMGLIIEVADSSLPGDRTDKDRIYARVGLPVYWIVNLVDRQIEVYTNPSGATASPTYADRREYRDGDHVPLSLDGITIGSIAVGELLP